MSAPTAKTVLIAIKAPPNPSIKYQEANCCAGIDLNSGEWVRLYPIPFRLLQYDKQFPKYSVISVNCSKPIRDKRVESFNVDRDSIKIIRHLDTENKWAERKKIVLPTLSSSFCKILEDVKNYKSLGIFKPTNIKFEVKKSAQVNEQKHKAAYEQYHLFDKKLDPIEQIPYSFHYSFECANSANCPGHKLMIHDWELSQSYRSWQHKYNSQELLLSKIQEKWLDDLCGSKKDTHFYVGNIWRRPKRFMVLGVFYPPK